MKHYLDAVVTGGHSSHDILATFGFVFVLAIRKKLPWKVALPFGINFVANVIFTPI